MVNDQELFEKIEAYLDNMLPEKERSEFEGRLTLDEDLASEVSKQRIIKEGLENPQTLDFQHKLNKIKEERRAEQDTPTYTMKTWHKVAAVISLLIVASIVFFQVNKNSNDDFFNEYYSLYEVQKIQRGTEAVDKSIAPFKYYVNGEYVQAIAAFIPLKAGDVYDRNEISIYLGNSYLNIDSTQLAIETFSEVNKESAYYDDALWYLALSYLKQDEPENAKNTLSILLSQNTIYDEPASDLLTKIN